MFFNFDFRFRLKYHPEESVKRKDEQLSALKVMCLKNEELNLEIQSDHSDLR